jgi:hypothetical protein
MAASGENNRYSQERYDWEEELTNIARARDAIRAEEQANVRLLTNVAAAAKNRLNQHRELYPNISRAPPLSEINEANHRYMRATRASTLERSQRRRNNTANLNRREAELRAREPRRPAQRRNGGKHTKSRRYHRKSHTRKRR